MSRISAAYRQIKEKSNKNVIQTICEILYFRICYKCSISYFIENSLFNDTEERNKYVEDLKKRRKWERDYFNEKKFLKKYSDLSQKQRKNRLNAFRKKYKTGKGFFIGSNSAFSREHYLDGKLLIGDNVSIGADVFIDYSGEVFLGDGITISAGTRIYSHKHILSLEKGDTQYHEDVIPVTTKILKGAFIFSGCIIYPGVTIGECAVIYPGSVVTCDVGDYQKVGGNPAKLISHSKKNIGKSGKK